MSEECRNWKGTFWNHGYGYIWWGGEDCLAHRVVYEIVNGPIPKHGQILHHCDNPKCVNPAHLYVGSCADNVADREDRKRSGLWFATSDKQRKQIRDLKGKMSMAQIARVVGCSPGTVARWIDGN